ncbi:MAG: transcription-repair coupling factor, partial [bacterium]|nr:transcription-repair coupling factor [bacterium]
MSGESARGPLSASLSGLTNTAKAIYLVLLWQATETPLVVVVDGSKQAENLSELVRTFFDLLVSDPTSPRPLWLPALDVLPHQHLSPHPEINEQRGIGLWRMAEGAAPITVTSIPSALLRTEPPEFYRRLALSLDTGDELPMELITEHLESVGYQRREPVEMVGEFSVRGGILDVYPPEANQPYRIDFFGDEVDSIRRFDVTTQRSVSKAERCLLLPLTECPKDRKLLADLLEKVDLEYPPAPGDTFPGWEFASTLVRPRSSTLFDLAPDATIVVDEPEQVRGAAERLWKRVEDGASEPLAPPEQSLLRWEEFEERLNGRGRILVRELELASDGAADVPSFHIPTKPSMTFRGNVQVAVAEARAMVEQGNRVVFFAPSAGELERLADIFQEYSMPFQLGLEPADGTPEYLAERAWLAGSVASTFLVRGAVRRGGVFPDTKLAVFGSEDLFETSDLVARPTAKPGAHAFASDIGDLKPDDYVVHATHGVGRFLGLREIAQGDQSGDFMLLEYAGDTKLYVPLTRLDLVQKYRSAGDVKPSLDKLGGQSWRKTKSRVKAKMRDMADELLRLYAERRMAEGHPFSSDSNWQREFDESFEFAETADQATAIGEIKDDMERQQPMDRLLCGDVGYGKTDVAMRAAFKALGDGKQVAVLAPTTVLSFQHFETFKTRFAPFPVKVEMVSRFRTPKAIKQVLEGVADGQVDIVIGTHRLLSKDVEFRDLGLMVVDEEQRFGVRHKERLKQLRKNVDVLTMTATPIPRTLHMSLLGLRDLSVIETPPKDRLAIQTVVSRFSPDLTKNAIEQELARGGQVYYIHNRVESIFARAASIQEMLPDCRIGVGHGQMGEAALEKVVLGFMRHNFDVLVSTTIVENGLDIPLANTILIENAERYGLAELYQLRGRVGRSNRRAYAYLLVPTEAELSEVARKRLAALREFSELGSGFKIAALDLELRGGGNLLGGEQHGHINMVGFDMYLRLLEQTVQELKGEEVPPEIHSKLSLGIDFRIPPDYIADDHQRLRAYKRIADAGEAKQADNVLADLEDRYGSPPEP